MAFVLPPSASHVAMDDTLGAVDCFIRYPILLAYAGVPELDDHILQACQSDETANIVAAFQAMAHDRCTVHQSDQQSGQVSQIVICVGDSGLTNAANIGVLLQSLQHLLSADVRFVIEMFPLPDESWASMESRYIPHVRSQGFYIQSANGFRRGHRGGHRVGLDGVARACEATAVALNTRHPTAASAVRDMGTDMQTRLAQVDNMNDRHQEVAAQRSVLRDLLERKRVIAILRPCGYMPRDRLVSSESIFLPTNIADPPPPRVRDIVGRRIQKRFGKFWDTRPNIFLRQ